MKQGINTTLLIHIDYNISAIEEIEFIFRQGDITKTFAYPSDNVTVVENNTCEHVIGIHWSKKDTFMFNCKDCIRMDTRIHLAGCDDNPETPIVKIKMNETLFED